MNGKIQFSAATRWDDDQLRRWANLSSDQRELSSIYGCRQEQLIGHGRAPADVPYVDDETIERHALLARSLGVKFLYLLNGNCHHLDLSMPSVRKEFLTDLEWIVDGVKADAVVVANPRAVGIIRSRYGPEKLAVRVSTVAGVSSPRDLEPWLQLGIEGVVLHHDTNRDFAALKRIIDFSSNSSPPINIELLLNESCIHGCSSRSTHYARLAETGLKYVEGFQQTCNLLKFQDPSLLLAANWIRPEDVSLYNQIGIQRFKIAGREMPRTWLDRTVSSYLSGVYNGNLVDLFTMTPPLPDTYANDLFFLDNRQLKDFLALYCERPAGKKSFYRDLAAKLWEKGALSVHDPDTIYSTQAGAVQCSKPGKHQLKLTWLQDQADHEDLNLRRQELHALNVRTHP